MTLVLPSRYLSFSVTVSCLNEKCKLFRAQGCISGFSHPLCTTMHAAETSLKLLNRTQIKQFITNFATLLNFLTRKQKYPLVWISVRSCLLTLGILRVNNNHGKAVLSLVMMFIESQSSSWGRAVESHCLGFWEQGWAKPETALQGSVPRWQEDEWEALRVFSICSSMILKREIDADSIQVVCPWLSCHVTAYGLKPVSQGMKNRWKEEENPPEVLTSSHLFLSEQGQLQTQGHRRRRGNDRRRGWSPSSEGSRVASPSPHLMWCGIKAWCELMDFFCKPEVSILCGRSEAHWLL